MNWNSKDGEISGLKPKAVALPKPNLAYVQYDEGTEQYTVECVYGQPQPGDEGHTFRVADREHGLDLASALFGEAKFFVATLPNKLAPVPQTAAERLNKLVWEYTNDKTYSLGPLINVYAHLEDRETTEHERGAHRTAALFGALAEYVREAANIPAYGREK